MNYQSFFKHATGFSPYHYQCKLACGPNASADDAKSLTSHNQCRSLLINIPTGLGKTAAVVIAWLWNRLTQPEVSKPKPQIPNPESKTPDNNALSIIWPRRLVYCLPMRTLVEQTADEVSKWLRNLRDAAISGQLDLAESALAELLWLAGTDGLSESQIQKFKSQIHAELGGPHSPIILMGGEELDPSYRDWDLYFEKPAILIGTQDMLLSRALNRGYAMSRYRWPIHFALLNNDCLWVMDETQLMGVGLETSAQLDAFRCALSTFNACPTWWMSATLEEKRLETIDHPRPANGWPTVSLSELDFQMPDVKGRLYAAKPIKRAEISLSGETRNSYAAQLARFVINHHKNDTLTLVVLNRVNRAQKIYEEIKKLKPDAQLALIHSRFRLPDRQAHEAVLHAKGSRIVIATQAVEAGVDVSACTLITELAPWSSLVQRFGRCNRRGEFKDGKAAIFFVDLKADDNEELAVPYMAEELARARAALEKLQDAGPHSLKSIQIDEPSAIRPVLRRKDIVELFDTTPDMAGYDLDISRYIRDGEDTDVQIFWRDCGNDPNQPLQPEPVADELCRVSLPRFREFLSKLEKSGDKNNQAKITAFRWNPLDEKWQPATTAQAGGTYMLDTNAGGYSPELGWLGADNLGQKVVSLAPKQITQEAGYASDPDTFAHLWVTLQDHTRAVVEETSRLIQSLAPEFAPTFLAAARWHDLGKAHEAFQKMLRGNDPARAALLWAKSANPGGRCERRYFRHELASALAWLQVGPADTPERDLVAYLIAAHHGKVRLSIRSFPGEEPPSDKPDIRIARGIMDGDTLPPDAFVAIGVSPPPEPVALSLEPMEMGQSTTGEPSWLARMLALRDRFHPFRLAWLECLLRAADARASKLASSASVSPAMELREDATASSLSPEERALIDEVVADDLSIQDKFRPEPLYKKTGRGHYQSSTVDEINRARKTRKKEDDQ